MALRGDPGRPPAGAGARSGRRRCSKPAVAGEEGCRGGRGGREEWEGEGAREEASEDATMAEASESAVSWLCRCGGGRGCGRARLEGREDRPGAVTGEAEMVGGLVVVVGVFKGGGRDGAAGAAKERGRGFMAAAGVGRRLRASVVGCRRGSGGGGLARDGWWERLDEGSEGEPSDEIGEPGSRSGISFRASGAEPSAGVIASCHGFGAELNAGLVASCHTRETALVRRGGGRAGRSLISTVDLLLSGDSIPFLALDGCASLGFTGGATMVFLRACVGLLVGSVTSTPARTAPGLIRRLGGRMGIGLMIASSFLRSKSFASGLSFPIDARRTAFSLASNSSTSEFVAGMWLSSFPSLPVRRGGTKRRLTGGFATIPSGLPLAIVAWDAAAARAAICEGDCCRTGAPAMVSPHGTFFSLDPLRAMAPRPAVREWLLPADPALYRVIGCGPVVTGTWIGGDGDAAFAAASAPLVLERFCLGASGGGEENARDAPRWAGPWLAAW